MAGVLIVDDDVAVRVMLRQILEGAGYSVLEARNGVEAVRLFAEDPADLVITDIVMPEKDGLETIFELRQDFRDVKIIAMSGARRSGPNSYLEMAEQLGARLALVKPLNPRRILAAVAELIGPGSGGHDPNAA